MYDEELARICDICLHPVATAPQTSSTICPHDVIANLRLVGLDRVGLVPRPDARLAQGFHQQEQSDWR